MTPGFGLEKLGLLALRFPRWALLVVALVTVALGYAGCWVEGQVRPNEEKLRRILGVGDELRVWSLTPIGKPAAAPARPPKSRPGEVTHYNRFGAKE